MTLSAPRSLVNAITGNKHLLSPTGKRTLMRLLAMLLAAMVIATPVTAAAQEQVGSVTVKKRPTDLDSPGAHPVKFELTGANLDAPVTLSSDTDTVIFTDLAPGTYTIRELATRTGDVARATVAPITVTIPTDGEYDITVYPKPQLPTLIKSANVDRIVPGTKFEYILDGTVPLPDTNGELHRYVIRDTLPAGLTLTGKSSMELRIGSRTVELTAGEHYNVTTEGNTITATFTPAGLELLAEERAEHAEVIVRFTFEVQAAFTLVFGSQVLNIGYLYPDGYPEDGDKSVVSNEFSLPVINRGGGGIIPLPIPIPGGSSGGSSGGPGGGPVLTPGSMKDTPDSGSVPTITPDKPGTPVASGPPTRPEPRKPLASTGASVLGVLALGALLSIIGITLFLRGRRA